MATHALHSLWVEPRPTNPPNRGPRDWALVAVLICWSLVEAVLRQNLVLRQDLAPRPFLLLAVLAVLGPLLWRRTHPLVAVAVSFGTLTIVVVLVAHSMGGLLCRAMALDSDDIRATITLARLSGLSRSLVWVDTGS